MTDSSDADERTMQEIDLPPFEAAIDQAHVASVMCSYNRVNGVYACENPYLLNTVLKEAVRLRRLGHVGLGRHALHRRRRATTASTRSRTRTAWHVLRRAR